MSDIETLARRAVRAKQWMWMQGMVTRDHGTVTCGGSGPIWTCEDFELDDEASPDLEHPATLGCLLELVRKAWSDPYAYARFRPGMLELESVGAWACYAAGTVYSGDSEAEALVWALEAAP